MTAHQIFILLLIALVLFILPAFGAYFMFKKAGVPAWKALVPGLNTYEMLKMSEKPTSWFFIQFIPVAGWFITQTTCSETEVLQK